VCAAAQDEQSEGWCGQQVLCFLCNKTKCILSIREEARECLMQQAEKMKNFSDASHSEAPVGSTVRIKVPEVDRGDARSILGVVLKKADCGFYQIGTPLVV